MKYRFLIMTIFCVTGCKNSTEVGLNTRVIGVQGTVTDGSGIPVAGARVNFQVLRPTCTGVFEGSGNTTTNTGGRYSVILSGSSIESVRCVKATATAGAQSQTKELPNLEFPMRFAVDTVTIDIKL